MTTMSRASETDVGHVLLFGLTVDRSDLVVYRPIDAVKTTRLTRLDRADRIKELSLMRLVIRLVNFANCVIVVIVAEAVMA